MTAAPEPAPLRHLVKRSEFLRAARGHRAGRTGFGLQAAPSENELPGVGFTVTKKVGNAPERNRIKRRLRAAVRSCAVGFQPRHDYVLIGRREALGLPFATLVADLNLLLGKIHEPKARRADNTEPVGSGNTRP
jgi:ribonuclease P protein component